MNRLISPEGVRQIAIAIKRWHFYAGLFVTPIFAVAALTGIVMALDAPLDRLFFPT